jgi:hypothetical protein
MSFGNLSVILMVILVAIVGVGGAFVATYYLNRAVRARVVKLDTVPAEPTNKGE